MKHPRPKYVLEFFQTDFPKRRLAEWYQWEFLRRNPEYQADYKKFERKHGEWLSAHGYWYDLTKRPKWTKSVERYFYTKIAPELVGLCVKWRVADLHPPKWRFAHHDDLILKKAERPSSPATGHAPELNWDYSLMKEFLEMGFTGQGGAAKRYGHLFLVEFDLTWPTKDSLDFAKRVLVRARNNYHEEVRDRGEHPPAGRRRFQNYDAHLKVWDLKQKGKSLSQIAELLFGLEDTEPARQRVVDHLKAARTLISGQYTEIR